MIHENPIQSQEQTPRQTPPGNLSPDYEAVERYLNILAPGENGFSFQTYPDVQKERPAREFHGAVRDRWRELYLLNNRQYAVCVAVNQTDLRGRQKENITGVRAVTVDLDDPKKAPISEVYKCGLEPHMIVESSPGRFHVYWLIAPGAGLDVERYELIQGAIAGRFNGDTGIKNINHVLRVPGFLHWKSGQPFQTKITEHNPGQPYTLDQVLEGLGLTLAAPKIINGFAEPADGDRRREPIARIRDALKYTPGLDEYEPWISTGMMIHSEHPGVEGFQLWEEWSAQSSKFKANAPGSMQQKWDGFKPKPGGLRINSLFNAAYKSGWKDSGGIEPVERADIDELIVNDAERKKAKAGPKAAKEEIQGATPAEVERKVRRPDLAVVSDASLFNTAPPPVDPIVDQLFERGDIGGIFGKSKSKKSFFAVQLGLCLASGKSFLWNDEGTYPQFSIPKPFRVLYVNDEIKSSHFHRRVQLVGEAIRVGLDETQGRFQALHLRGVDIELAPLFERLKRIVVEGGIDVLIFDPIYKRIEGEENTTEGMKKLFLEMDNLVTATGAALLYIHHDKKGSTEGTPNVDRGSGSGVVGRHYDAAFFLSAQPDKSGRIIVDTESRNYKTRPRVLTDWVDGRFQLSDAEPITKAPRATTNPTSALPLGELTEPALRLLGDELRTSPEIKDLFKTVLDLSVDKANSLYSQLTRTGALSKLPGAKRQGLPDLVGLPWAVEAVREAREKADQAAAEKARLETLKAHSQLRNGAAEGGDSP